MDDGAEPPIGLEAYERIADAYAARLDTKPHNAYYERPALLALLPNVQRLRILDLGCGPGLYAERLLEAGAAHITAIDVSPRMVALAQARLPSVRTDIRLTDAREPLSFLGDSAVDLVIAPLMVHYLPRLEPVFVEIGRVLRTSGHFVFSTHHPMVEFPEYSATGQYFATEPVEQVWGSLGAVRFYRRPLSDITEALAAAGFVIERLVEPKPTDEYREASPNGYARLMRMPDFLLVRARRDT